MNFLHRFTARISVIQTAEEFMCWYFHGDEILWSCAGKQPFQCITMTVICLRKNPARFSENTGSRLPNCCLHQRTVLNWTWITRFKIILRWNIYKNFKKHISYQDELQGMFETCVNNSAHALTQLIKSVLFIRCFSCMLHNLDSVSNTPVSGDSLPFKFHHEF